MSVTNKRSGCRKIRRHPGNKFRTYKLIIPEPTLQDGAYRVGLCRPCFHICEILGVSCRPPSGVPVNFHSCDKLGVSWCPPAPRSGFFFTNVITWVCVMLASAGFLFTNVITWVCRVGLCHVFGCVVVPSAKFPFHQCNNVGASCWPRPVFFFSHQCDNVGVCDVGIRNVSPFSHKCENVGVSCWPLPGVPLTNVITWVCHVAHRRASPFPPMWCNGCVILPPDGFPFSPM